MNRVRLGAALQKATDRLLSMRTIGGFWEGRLSSSALSTATAVSALSIAAQSKDTDRIRAGVVWLTKTQNADGGWGDTPDSPSNLSTSLLVSATFHLAVAQHPSDGTAKRLDEYLNRVAGSSISQRREAICAAYTPDRTFAVPILTNLALAGAASWEEIPPLPYELAALPPSFFRFLRLHVVSYALPALIAVGLTLEHHQPPRSFIRRWLRAAVRGKALRKLEAIQPSSGGFLEAVPLTSFVTMSLVPLHGHTHPVARKGLDFLRASARDDGSWPIDTNLSVWLTTAAVAALCEADVGGWRTEDSGQTSEGGGQKPEPPPSLPFTPHTSLSARSWLLSAQHKQRHPYTDSAPGGWAWTNLPGGVPDTDDTAGAILALIRLGESGPAIEAGVRWLLDLQNTDGGWPTFCRGWGHLPFDRSAPDLSAHVLRALAAFDPERKYPGVRAATRRGFGYLRTQQLANGSWRPLWFGNQATQEQANPVLGTARVLRALDELAPADEATLRGIRYLLEAQNPDGGWGGEVGIASTVEETALAVSALAGQLDESNVHTAVWKGVFNLVECLESQVGLKPAPIGLYFARLWYSEEAYPLIWTVEALSRVLTRAAGSPTLSDRDVADLGTNCGDRTAHAS